MGLHRFIHLCSGALLLGACGGVSVPLGETGDDAGAAGGAAGSSQGQAGTAGTPMSSGAGGSVLSGGSAGSSLAGSTGGSSFAGSTGGSSFAGGTGGSSGMGNAGSSAGGMPVCNPLELPASRLRPLTPLEYDNTVRDLLGVAPAQPARLTAAYTESGFISPLPDDSHYIAEVAKAAVQVAAAAQPDIPRLMNCAADETEDGCALRFLNEFNMKAVRRPLTVDESKLLKDRFALARETATAPLAGRDVIAWILNQPSFVLVESGTRATSGLLGPYALASRLSYFLTRSMPDQTLLAAAAAGELQNVAGVAAQARRLLATPGGHDAIRDFFSQWLQLDQIIEGNIAKDPVLYPNFTQLAPDMVTETLMFTEQVVFGGGGLPSLLLNPTTFVNENLGALYGLPVTGTSFRQVSLAGIPERVGLLTQASWLALHSHQVSTSPVRRGQWITNKLFCKDIPPPPPGVLTPPDNLPANATTRQRMEQHTASPVCASCHRLMDPIGFGFEHYDAIGQYRALENGMVIDSTGSITGSMSGPIAFDGADNLSQLLTTLPEVNDCIATQLFRFALLRREDQADLCSVVSVQSALRTGTFQDALLAIATSDSFRYQNW